MKLKILFISIVFIPLITIAQNKSSKADNYFYGYQYEKAISEYQKEMIKDSLTNQQKLNLADSYLKVGEFDTASKIYLEVNKNDTIMSVHRLNKMFQSLAKNSDKERVKTFMRSKAAKLSSELMENAEFNYALLENDNSEKELGIIKNINTNTPQDDFSPAFYKNGILFSSSRIKKEKGVYAPSGESYLDIYFGKNESSGNIKNVENFAKIPDSKFHKATPFYSNKTKTFYYILSNTENGEMAFDKNGKNALAVGSLNDSGKFGFVLRDLSTSFYYPFFDDNTGRLFFAANFEDGYGGTDLYFVFTNNGQIMSAPVNLGPRINSPGNEISPYIFNGSLYFSSDVFYGLGGMDVYKSNMLPDNSFTIPINIGNDINSVKDDFGFIIKENGDDSYSGYFSSNREGGKGGDDLYGFTLKSLPGLRTFSLQGTVVDTKTNTGLLDAQVKIMDISGNEIYTKFTDDNGEFRIEIPWRDQVTVRIIKPGFSIFDTSYSEEGMEQIQDSPFMIGLSKLNDLLTESENKTIIKLDKFYFNKGKSDINQQVQEELDKVVDAVQKFPELKLKIENHTDSRGSSYTNKKLSQNRVETIKKYLLNAGLQLDNILEAKGYGEEKIKNNCKNGVYCLDFLHKQNERTLFIVVK